MATKISDLPGYTVVNIASLTATVEKDVAAGPCTLYGISIVAGAGSGSEYVKLWDDKNPTHGTTESDEQWEYSLGETNAPLINPPNGIKFENGLSIAAAQEASTSGTTNPSVTVAATLILVKDAA